MNIYVGNLPYGVNEDELREMFERFGAVHTSKVIMDRETGRSRGFGFVEMDDADGATAIQEMNNSDMGGRRLKVNESEPRKPFGSRGPGGPRR